MTTAERSRERLRRRICAAALIVGALTCGRLVPVTSAQTAENVGVVINDNSPASREIGEYYVRKRGVPASNVFRIRTSVDETINRPAYVATIEQPLMAAINRLRLHDRLLYLVLTKGVPLRIAGETATVASVDSELTLLYPRLAGESVGVAGRADNPYFLNTQPPSAARRFSHREFPIYLVTRLDAFTTKEALALVDRALAPSRQGRIVLDQQAGGDKTGEQWLLAAADRLKEQREGNRVLLDTTARGVRDVTPVLGYYSWGSNDPGNLVRTFNLGLVPGSIAAMYVSSDARTFREPPAEWRPSADPTKSFGGSGQSLIGDLIREGATGVAGHVAEPMLNSTIRPDILFPAYLSGMNLAEAFYLAMPYLSWQTVVIGDPLCAPFARQPLARSDTAPALDPQTELPAFFSQRRLRTVTRSMKGVSREALALAVRGEGRLARGDGTGAREAFEEVVRMGPTLTGAHLQLAILYDGERRFDDANDRYRQVLKLQPNNVIALNNLAHNLAVRQGNLEQGLALAKQAGAIEPRNPTVLDTLAWIEHLRGNNEIAAKLIAIVVQRIPSNGHVRLRAAAIYAATGAAAQATTELAAAVKLEPSLAKSDETERIREQLRKLGR